VGKFCYYYQNIKNRKVFNTNLRSYIRMEGLETLVGLPEEPRDQNRRTVLIALIGALANPGIFLPDEAHARMEVRQQNTTKIDYSKIPLPHVTYKQIVKEQNLAGISLPDSVTEIGRVQRALRWSNITEAVENRYRIPRRCLLGMVCAESEGDPTQPNASGDGGAGLIHMQPRASTQYGLRLISPSTKLVDYEQGKLLRRAIQEAGGDLRKLIRYDDRFHPIKNIDAAARILCDLYLSQNHRNRSWHRALNMYAGRPTYSSKVVDYARKISSKNFRRVVEFNFNSANKDVIIGSRIINFRRYLQIFHEQNRNFGLDLYSKMVKAERGMYCI